MVFLIGQLGRAGSERQLYLLLKNMDAGRFERSVIVFNPSARKTYDQALERIGVEVIAIPPKYSGVFGRLRFIHARLRRLRPHVVHSWTLHDNPYAGVAGRLARVPVRWGSLRGSFLSAGMQSQPWLYKFLCLRGVSRIIVNSQSLVQEVKTLGLPAERVDLASNCIDIPADEGDSRKTPPSDIPVIPGCPPVEGRPLIGIVGNLKRVKNHLMFVRAIAALRPRFPGVRALIVGQPSSGEPEVETEIRREIDRLGLAETVILTGFREDAVELMRHFTLFCMTSNSEGLPNAVLEAMAAGCPVVSTRVGGVPEIIIKGVNGWLVDPGDAPGLTAALDHLLNHPELARELGAKGRETVKNRFSCGAIAAQMERLYERAVSRRAGG